MHVNHLGYIDPTLPQSGTVNVITSLTADQLNILNNAVSAVDGLTQKLRALVATMGALGLPVSSELVEDASNALGVLTALNLESQNNKNKIGGYPGIDLTTGKIPSTWLPASALGSGIQQSVLINGGFDFAQDQAAATLTNKGTNAADAYGPDGWKVGIQNAIAVAQAQYQRTDTNGALETGITARMYGTVKMTAAASKAMLYQPIEGSVGFPLASRTVTFQVKLKASTARTLNIGVLALGSGGTIDTIAGQLNTAWANGAGSDPTWAANVTLQGSKVACAVTTSWKLFSVTVTLPSNAKNILPVIWADSQLAINDTFSVTECQLFDGSTAQAWLPPTLNNVLAACQRYCYVVDSTSPGGTTAFVGAGMAFSTTSGCVLLALPVPMRAGPTLTATAADWAVFAALGGNLVLTALTINTGGTPFGAERLRLDFTTSAASLVSGNATIMIANVLASKRMIFDARL